MNRILSGATTPGQSRPGSDSNEGVVCIPQRSTITGALLSDCLMSYTGHSLRVALHLWRDAVGIFNSSSRRG